LVKGARESKELKVIAVVNIARPMTASVSDIVDYLRELGRVDAVINNSHLGEETTVDLVQEGARVVSEASHRLELPVMATTVLEAVAEKIGSYDVMGNPVKPIQRFMTESFW
jgi:hypothetical protein